MSETAHTPGPWRVDIDRAIVADHRARGIWRTVVADVGLPGGPGGAGEREANARLIAAAPDLLEALEELVRINVEHNESISAIIRKPLGWKDTYLDAARAAIAKAKGEQP